jgi:hypothetical protein
VKRVRYEGPKFFKPSREKFFIPLEFSVAAYRFGHSKVRETYHRFNERQSNADLRVLFAFTAGSGSFAGLSANSTVLNIPGDWVIDWKNFFNSDDPSFFSRPIDTTLAAPLLDLSMDNGRSIKGEKNLAIRNLLRGYILKLPTGQAVAKALGIEPMDKKQILRASGSEQRKVLRASKFLEQTPLWFYILAEAAHYSRGYHLGPVGSTIVAEVLIGILRYSDYSILADTNWKPTLGSNPHKFDLADFLKLAGVF